MGRWIGLTRDVVVTNMFNGGKTYLEIAEALGTTRNAIAGVCKRLGLRREPSQLRYRGRSQAPKPVISAAEQAEREQDHRDLDMLADLDEGHSETPVRRALGRDTELRAQPAPQLPTSSIRTRNRKMSDQQELKLQCLREANGDMHKAQEMFKWVHGADPADTLRQEYDAWANGDKSKAPDWDSELYEIFDSGITYAICSLAHLLDVKHYKAADGSETLAGDVSGTLANILIAAGYRNEDGDLTKPHEIAQTSAIAALEPTTSGPSPETARAFNLPADEGEYYANVRDRIVGDEAEQQASVDMAAAVERAKQAGAKAREAGEDSTACPYPQDSLEATAWTGAWIEGDGAKAAPVIPEGFTKWEGASDDNQNPNIPPATLVEIIQRNGEREVTLAGDHDWCTAETLKLMMPEDADDFDPAEDIIAYRVIEPQASEGEETRYLTSDEEAIFTSALFKSAKRIEGENVAPVVEALQARKCDPTYQAEMAAAREVLKSALIPDVAADQCEGQPERKAGVLNDPYLDAIYPKPERPFWPFGGKLVGG